VIWPVSADVPSAFYSLSGRRLASFLVGFNHVRKGAKIIRDLAQLFRAVFVRSIGSRFRHVSIFR
jgi:hypothetical protein